MTKIGLIGTGNMGKAVLTAVSAALPCAEFYLANRTEEKAEAFSKRIGNAKVVKSKDIATECDTIFLAVKPQNLEEVMDEIAGIIRGRKDRVLVISMIAGYSAAEVQSLTGSSQPVIFMMPNTPVSIGSGVILYNSVGTTDDEEKSFEEAMSCAGYVHKCDEKHIGPAGSLTGCGPALVYMLIGSLADSAVHEGIPRDKAVEYASLMVLGSAKMVYESGREPETLKNEVCSPAGTTIQMVRKLEETGFRASIFESMLSAINAKPKK